MSFVFAALGFSPVGFVVPYFFLSMMGACRGALGSGVRCRLPLGSGYFEALAVYMELSCFMFGACLLWIAVALIVWCGALYFALKAIAQAMRGKSPSA